MNTNAVAEAILASVGIGTWLICLAISVITLIECGRFS